MIKSVGLITARGGSKAIPHKNVRMLAGKPLIAWTIEAALRARTLNKVIVSTEDEEIAQVAKAWGAEVPFMRPAQLAQDTSPHIPVVMHAMDWLDKHETGAFDLLALLQPTSPLRTAQDIDEAIELYVRTGAESVVSVSEARSHPFLTKSITADGRLEDFGPQPEGYLARQTLPTAYALNGAIYLVKRDVLLKERTFLTNRTYAYIMPDERSLDIDTPWDLYLADLILSNRDKSE